VERLSALANLSPRLRLLLLASPEKRPDGLVRAAQAALLLQRYLTGPGLVPGERISFAVSEIADSGDLGLSLVRLEEE
jgi:hypothetical protein